MSEILADIPDVLVFINDILIHGPTADEYINRVFKVLERLKSKGITLNPEKCIFYASELTFLGHKISEKGVEPSPEKMREISDISLPEAKEQLRSFLGCYLKMLVTVLLPIFLHMSNLCGTL